jgi:hypothetical protein
MTLYQIRLIYAEKKNLGGVQSLDSSDAAWAKQRAQARKEKQKWPPPVVPS